MEDFAQIISPAHPYCRQFRQVFPIAVDPQADMDIAFTLVVHDEMPQIARLLRMIYRINNYYCIHIDKRSSIEFQLAMRGVVTCFGANVELVPGHLCETGAESSCHLEVLD
uniref:Protein xylosyltransferase n=1 Tax=Mesocestoides corti TaxID=53468 RepID=A0A5K3G4Z6_MESCO